MIATVNGVSSPRLIVKRPSWRDMYKNYPNESIPSESFYPMVSQKYVKLVTDNPDNWANTCATRMSYALNRSGIKLPFTGKKHETSIKGDDRYNYWIRVKELKSYLFNRFGTPDIFYSPKQVTRVVDEQTNKLAPEVMEKVNFVRSEFLAKIQGKKGIVVFDVSGWTDASGHFTLWDGANLVYVGPGDHNNPNSLEYYFWLTRNGRNNKVIQAIKISFWELK